MNLASRKSATLVDALIGFVIHYETKSVNLQTSKDLNLASENKEILHSVLTRWGRVAHICVSELTIIASDNGLSPARHQAIVSTSAGILLIGPLGTNFSEISIEIITFSFKKMRLKVSSAKWRPFCLGLNVLKFQSCLRWYHKSSLRYRSSKHGS